MKTYLKVGCTLIIMTLSFFGFIRLWASPSNVSWVCASQDATQASWVLTDIYKNVAKAQALEACKKQSSLPATCRMPESKCDSYVDGILTSPMWQCISTDFLAVPWRGMSKTSPHKAALESKINCKENSSLPDTCSLNFVTCRNINVL